MNHRQNTLIPAFCVALPLLVASSLHAQLDFAPVEELSTSYPSHVVAMGDVNGDGFADVVVGTDGAELGPDRMVQVFPGSATGVGITPTTYPFTTNYPGLRSIDVADVTGDGLQDVIVGHSTKLGIFRQAGDHTLLPVQTLTFTALVGDVATGDLNNDGLTDIVSSHVDGLIRVHVQTAGGFNTVTYPMGSASVHQLRTADMNDDGLMDVIGLGTSTPQGISVYKQTVLGELSAAQFWPLPISLWNYEAMAVGDLDHDGLADVAVTRSGNGSNTGLFLIYQHPITHALDSIVTLPAYEQASAVQLGDLDCDDDLEVVVLHPGWQAFSVYTRIVDGPYGAFTTFPMPYVNMGVPDQLALGHVDGDQRIDLLCTNATSLLFAPNTSFPAVPDSIQLTVDIDVQATDTVYAPGLSFTTTVDTIGWEIVLTSTQYTLQYTIQHEMVQIDSLSVRYGALCGMSLVDTLSSSGLYNLYDTLGIDTLDVVIYMDTLNVGLTSMPEGGTLGIHPNPTSDQVILRWPINGFPRNPSGEVLNAAGIVVRRFTPGVPPYTLELGDLPPGVYLMRVAAAGRTWQARVAVQ
jgi:hypothetical protein